MVFLERLAAKAPLPAAHLTHLGTLYGFASSPNAEIRTRFYTLALPYAPAFAEPAAQWVTGKDGSGKLWDDVFADKRILLMPPSVGALLVLFCRNHNVRLSTLSSISD